MAKIRPLLLLIALLPGISGCLFPPKDLENIGITLQFGLETTTAGLLQITHTQMLIDGKQKNMDEQLVTESESIRESRQVVRRISSKIVEGGKIQQILFSNQMARQGLHQYLELFQRDSLNPPLVSVVVVDGSPHELMEKALQFKNKPPAAIYIKNLLSDNTGLYIPESRIIQFDIAFFAPGIDPVAPLLRLTKTDVEVIGTALFSGDRMVGSIGSQESSLLLAVLGQLKPMDFIFDIPGVTEKPNSAERRTAVLFSKVKPKIEIIFRDGKPSAKVDLQILGKINEYQWDQLNDPASQKKLEDALNRELTREVRNLLHKLQKMNCDPVGFGDLIRAKYNHYWRTTEKKAIYRNLQYRIGVKLSIQQYGSIH